MEQDALKSAWQQAGSRPGAMQHIPAAGRSFPPALKAIRRQLLVESLGYAAFLLMYYDFFDGREKPFYLNALLVLCISLMLLHNIAGYLLIKNPVKAGNLKQSLTLYLQRVRQFSVVSLLSRLLGISGLLLFFLAQITWSATKYWILAGVLLFLGIQLFSLYRVWSGRIGQISSIVKDLDAA
ncbi:hypothetical protein [Chitinophaga japonensis]|uniref:Uncharacterized protein n=1 Tax=Chitinophaga japonensis TaxID=104662 RepID=A0A562TC87_CHIJA|nr:hypothetical protein [Chitinophaga japonensis]TWI91129.1 hypothetical protein LX66_0491 [Chitinophaga japonensis]